MVSKSNASRFFR